jgi:hypothetical protein
MGCLNSLQGVRGGLEDKSIYVFHNGMASIRAFGAGWASDSAGNGHAFVRGLSLDQNKGERGMGILGVSPWRAGAGGGTESTPSTAQ